MNVSAILTKSGTKATYFVPWFSFVLQVSLLDQYNTFDTLIFFNGQIYAKTLNWSTQRKISICRNHNGLVDSNLSSSGRS